MTVLGQPLDVGRCGGSMVFSKENIEFLLKEEEGISSVEFPWNKYGCGHYSGKMKQAHGWRSTEAPRRSMDLEPARAGFQPWPYQVRGRVTSSLTLICKVIL